MKETNDENCEVFNCVLWGYCWESEHVINDISKLTLARDDKM